MAGLESATAGTVEWPGLGGHSLAHPGRVGVVFQGPSLLPALTSAKNVALPLQLADPVAGKAARAALDRLGIGELASSLPQ